MEWYWYSLFLHWPAAHKGSSTCFVLWSGTDTHYFSIDQQHIRETVLVLYYGVVLILTISPLITSTEGKQYLFCTIEWYWYSLFHHWPAAHKESSTCFVLWSGTDDTHYFTIDQQHIRKVILVLYYRVVLIFTISPLTSSTDGKQYLFCTIEWYWYSLFHHWPAVHKGSNTCFVLWSGTDTHYFTIDQQYIIETVLVLYYGVVLILTISPLTSST